MNAIFQSLYWRISLTFLLLLVVLGCAYVFISVQTAERYFQDKQQRLNASIAQHMVQETQPFNNGEVNKESMDKIMHSMMAINPAIEVYLLDTVGNILSFVAPYKKVKLKKVSLDPLHEFIETQGEKCVLGDDPRNPGIQKVFSAAPVEENGRKVGYAYIVLASEEYDSVSEYLFGSFLLNLGTYSILFTFVAAIIIGLIAFYLITRYLRTIIDTVRLFASGDLHARIPVQNEHELSQLATTFNEMADTIEADHKKRETLENLRRELIANVSHDLRTPLAVIHGYIETLSMKWETVSQEERNRYMKTSLRSIEKLEKLVNDLFELSKLEADQVQPQKEPFPISELIQDVVYKYQLLANEKNISLTPVLTEEMSIVHADIALIERVLQNLIDNAIKFTPAGGHINIEIARKTGEVVVQVMDDGPGIPEEDVPFVFDRYHKAKQSGNQSGTGLGLAIVKKILELHQSVIQLKSQPGEGCTFAFALPIYPVTMRAQAISE